MYIRPISLDSFSKFKRGKKNIFACWYTLHILSYPHFNTVFRTNKANMLAILG